MIVLQSFGQRMNPDAGKPGAMKVKMKKVQDAI